MQTSVTLINFVLAMLHYPGAMRKAQAELDAVVGQGRPPTFDDMPNLPYIRAMVKETLRWRPIAPLGMYHMSYHGIQSIDISNSCSSSIDRSKQHIFFYQRVLN